MERIKSSSAISILPAAVSTGIAGYFRDPTDGVQTIVTNDWCNGIQEELANTIEASGETLNIADNKLLLKSVRSGLLNFETTTGPANAYVLTFATPYVAYVKGMVIKAEINANNTGASTINVDGLGSKNITYPDGTALKGGELTTGKIAELAYDGANFQLLNLLSVSLAQIIQFQSFETGAVATGTTAIPFDDTIPQNTEGDQYMSLSITPKNASNKLIIDVTIHLANTGSGAVQFTAGLFQDSTVNALAAGSRVEGFNASDTQSITFRHIMTAGTTSATTFKVRAGGNQVGTTTFNGATSARTFGGVLASSITITEIAA